MNERKCSDEFGTLTNITIRNVFGEQLQADAEQVGDKSEINEDTSLTQ